MKTLEKLMEDNLFLIWSQRDAAVRIELIRAMYTENAVLYEMGEEISGQTAINQKISGLLNNMPPDFTFTLLKPALVNKDMGRLLWSVGPKDQPPVQSGMDIVLFENGKIKSLYVFLEK